MEGPRTQETWAPGRRAASPLHSRRRSLGPWDGLKPEMRPAAPGGPALDSSPNPGWLARGAPAQKPWASSSGPRLWGVLGGCRDQVAAPPGKSGVTGREGARGAAHRGRGAEVPGPRRRRGSPGPGQPECAPESLSPREARPKSESRGGCARPPGAPGNARAAARPRRLLRGFFLKLWSRRRGRADISRRKSTSGRQAHGKVRTEPQ